MKFKEDTGLLLVSLALSAPKWGPRACKHIAIDSKHTREWGRRAVGSVAFTSAHYLEKQAAASLTLASAWLPFRWRREAGTLQARSPSAFPPPSLPCFSWPSSCPPSSSWASQFVCILQALGAMVIWRRGWNNYGARTHACGIRKRVYYMREDKHSFIRREPNPA